MRPSRTVPSQLICALVTAMHGGLVLVSQAVNINSYTAELTAEIQRQAFDYLDAPIERVSGGDCPLPYAKELEQSAIPHAPDVVAAAKKAIGV
jgi:pyruvate dehydrogenase E1 component beta subunit